MCVCVHVTVNVCVRVNVCVWQQVSLLILNGIVSRAGQRPNFAMCAKQLHQTRALSKLT